ncbi:junctional adhesion molecule-like isoform X2 [Pristis pectinata]|uniref:junctional adhesion molecule-like isoform X2 n=1 Tax=Pristis pectinata TaxID=685728 RepID=UPI00223D3547|nr:junctional adhesion molecule-like isoform X2 [Pristis pectinata]
MMLEDLSRPGSIRGEKQVVNVSVTAARRKFCQLGTSVWYNIFPAHSVNCGEDNSHSIDMSNKHLSAVTLFLCVAVGLKATTVLIQSPGDVKVREGETVLIQCVLESSDVQDTVEKYDVHWYNSRSKLNQEGIVLSLYNHGSVYRSPGFSDRFQLSRNVTSNSYSLTISDVKTTDSADYICGIWGHLFGKGTRLNVTSADVPVLMQSPSLEHVTEGHTARLWCTMTRARLQDTDVHWYRKLPGQDLEWVLTHDAGGSPQWGPGFTERFLPYRDTSNSSFVLTVTDVEPSDSAVYYCRVWGDISGNGSQLIVNTPPAAAEDQTPAADYENVSKAREIPTSADPNATYMALQQPTQSTYGHLQGHKQTSDS